MVGCGARCLDKIETEFGAWLLYMCRYECELEDFTFKIVDELIQCFARRISDYRSNDSCVRVIRFPKTSNDSTTRPIKFYQNEYGLSTLLLIFSTTTNDLSTRPIMFSRASNDLRVLVLLVLALYVFPERAMT